MQAAPEMGLSAFVLAKVPLSNSSLGTRFPGSSWHQLKARLPLLLFKVSMVQAPDTLKIKISALAQLLKPRLKPP